MSIFTNELPTKFKKELQEDLKEYPIMLSIRMTKIEIRNANIFRAVLADSLGNMVTIIYDSSNEKISKTFDNVHLMQSIVEKFDKLTHSEVRENAYN